MKETIRQNILAILVTLTALAAAGGLTLTYTLTENNVPPTPTQEIFITDTPIVPTATPKFCINRARVNTGGSKLLIRNPNANWSVVGSLNNGVTVNYVTETPLIFNGTGYVRLENTSNYVAQTFLVTLSTGC